MESSQQATEEQLVGGAIVEVKLQSFEDQEKLIKESLNERQLAVYWELKAQATDFIKETFAEGEAF